MEVARNTPSPVPSPPLVIADRGLAGPHSENTIGAFQSALDAGADVIELDLRRTRDGVLVVHHDARLGHRWLGPRIRDLDYASLPPVGPHGERIPRLDEVVDVVRGRALLNVELNEIGYEVDVADRLLEEVGPGGFAIRSIRRGSIDFLTRARPEVWATAVPWDARARATIMRWLAPHRQHPEQDAAPMPATGRSPRRRPAPG